MRTAAAEKANEELGKTAFDLLEGSEQALTSFAVEAGDPLAQAGNGGDQILPLPDHAVEPICQFLGFLLRPKVYRPDALALLLQPLDLAPHLLSIRERSEEHTSELQSRENLV